MESSKFTASTRFAFDDGTKHLRATTARASTRYERTAPDIIETSHAVIMAGPLSARADKQTLPAGWSAHIHPEGQLYFHRSSQPQIVTEAYIYREAELRRITFWSDKVKKLLAEKSIPVSDNVELFLELDSFSEDCAYYLIDHSTRTEFWLDPVSTETLDMPPVVSSSHLQIALEQHYWLHVECFPMHFGGLRSSAVDELLGILSHGQADHITSSVSTFPYTSTQCAEFLGILKNTYSFEAQIPKVDGYITCFAARFWSVITENRFKTHYGQEHSRLSRDQTLLSHNPPIVPQHRIWNLISMLTFRTMDSYNTRFEDVFVDDLVYADQWQSFMVKCIVEWKFYSGWSLSLLLPTILLSASGSASPILGTVSSLLCGLSVLSTTVLISQHEELADGDASVGANHLQSIRSDSSRFRPVALVFSIPKFTFGWALVLALLQGVILTSRTVSMGVAVFMGLLLLLTVKFIRQTLSPTSGVSAFAHESLLGRLRFGFPSRRSTSPPDA